MQNLSYQQKKIILILRDEMPHSINEFKFLFTNCNIYPSLNKLLEKELIKKIGKKYYITNKGHTLSMLITLLKI